MINDRKTRYTRKELDKHIKNDLLTFARRNKVKITTDHTKKEIIDRIMKAQREKKLNAQVSMEDTRQKVGRPRTIETPSELIELFFEFYEAEAVERVPIRWDNETGEPTTYKERKNLLTIEGFMFYLRRTKKISGMSRYWYDLPSEFADAKAEIVDIMRNQWQQASTRSHINPQIAVFYAKNAYGMSDRTEAINTNVNTNLTSEDLTAEEIEKYKNIVARENGNE